MQPNLLPFERWKRNVLNAVILFHVIAIPLGSYWTEAHGPLSGLKHFFCNYVYGMRIRQYWALFSPDPRYQAVRYFAYIVFKDGHNVQWHRPYAPKWNFFERHLAYNFQKWDLVSNNLDFKSGLWDSLVHYLMKQYQSDKNPVVEIQFIRSSAPWPKPQTSGYVGGETENLVWTDRVLFTYDAMAHHFL